MELGAIFVLIAVFLLAGLFVARPFLESRVLQAVSAQDQELSSLLAERERLLTALQELDFDHVLHKIPAEEYPAMRATLMQKAAEVLRALDTFQAIQTAADAETRLETEIAARRADAAQRTTHTPEADDAIEGLIAARKAARREKSGGFCTKCGTPVLSSDSFCPKCGQRLSKESL